MAHVRVDSIVTANLYAEWVQHVRHACAHVVNAGALCEDTPHRRQNPRFQACQTLTRRFLPIAADPPSYQTHHSSMMKGVLRAVSCEPPKPDDSAHAPATARRDAFACIGARGIKFRALDTLAARAVRRGFLVYNQKKVQCYTSSSIDTGICTRSPGLNEGIPRYGHELQRNASPRKQLPQLLVAPFVST